MATVFPGTTIEVSTMTRGSSRTLFNGIFAAGGITLSQVSIMTGLEPYMIQNWVKRGWIEPPKDRRYGETSIARVLIINMLKGAMQLSNIVSLMSYINGKVDDRSDDIIEDAVLYDYICKILDKLMTYELCSLGSIRQAIIDGKEEFCAKVIRKSGEVEELTLYVKGLTEDEKEIILDGCLMNYYKNHSNC